MTIDIDLTEEEIEAIEELRKRIKGEIEDELYDDPYLLLRFLRARDFNLNNAEAMLRKHVVFRKNYDLKNISKFKKSEVMEKYFINVILGYDKEGCVIRFSPCGSVDFLGLLSSCTHEQMLKLLVYEMETETAHLKKKSEELGRNIDKCVFIYDLENLSFAICTDKKAIKCLIATTDIFINNYPERMKAVFAINVPIYFTVVYSVLKAVLPKRILDKFHLYSDDSYKEDILKVIDADVLPAFLGGNRTDPDGNPRCVTLINPAEPVPESYYLTKSKRALANQPGVQKTTLSNAAFHEVFLDVKEAGSYLEWEFETKCRDIGFGVFYNELVDGEEKITELVPIQRIDTEMYPETGTFICENPGRYVIVFDNTYSWVRSKEIYYRTKIVTPKEHEAEIKE